jgi:hypothetical protein
MSSIAVPAKGTVLIGGEFVRNQFGQCTANAEIEEAEVA